MSNFFFLVSSLRRHLGRRIIIIVITIIILTLVASLQRCSISSSSSSSGSTVYTATAGVKRRGEMHKRRITTDDGAITSRTPAIHNIYIYRLHYMDCYSHPTAR